MRSLFMVLGGSNRQISGDDAKRERCREVWRLSARCLVSVFECVFAVEELQMVVMEVNQRQDNREDDEPLKCPGSCAVHPRADTMREASGSRAS